MTVDGGTNHYWGWGDNYYGEVGNGIGGEGSLTSTNQYTPAGPLQFCTRCQRCVQLGTSGILTAQCTGTLTLYFNDAQGQFWDDSGSFTVSVSGLVTNQAVPACVPWDNTYLNNNAVSVGVAVGIVTNGGVYNYTASGFCTYDIEGDMTDPNGNLTNGAPADCSFIRLNITNAVCPTTKCFSLVGKIQ
jgi:hypothetical protein